MKKTILASILALATAVSANALTIGVDAGTNLTNDGTNLLPDTTPPANQNAATILDWLDNVGSIQPGQIQGYNNITSSSLPQPAQTAPDYAAEDATNNGNYMFAVGTYYVAAHFGGFEAVWLLEVTDAAAKYGFIADINGTGGKDNGGGGYSNFRAWLASPSTSVPDSGATLAFLGLGLTALALLKKKSN